MTATPMTTQRSHQYFPRWRPSGRLASPQGASCDTPFRVTAAHQRISVPGAGAPSRYATGMSDGLSVAAGSSDRVSIDPAADAAVHPVVRKAAAWSWRLLIILGALVALLWVVKHLEVIVVPVALATMI